MNHEYADRPSNQPGNTTARLAYLLLLLLIPSLGCPSRAQIPSSMPNSDSTEASNATAHETSDLRLLVIDDPQLQEVIEREWRANTGGEVTATSVTSSEFIARIATASDNLDADIVIFPCDLLGTMVERKLIRKFSSGFLEDPQLERDDIFDLPRLHEMKWGDATYALPLGSPQFVYYYRTDVVGAVQSTLTPPGSPTSPVPPGSLAFPQTWQAYHDFVTRYPVTVTTSDAASAAAPAMFNRPRYACVEPLARGWAGKVLLARAVSAIHDRGRFASPFDIRSAKPLIAEPPFVRALDQLVDAYHAGPPEARDFTPEDAARFFWSGQAAMALSWPSAARDIPNAKEGARQDSPAGALPMSFAELPGTTDRFDFGRNGWTSVATSNPQRVALIGATGRVVAVTRGAGNVRAAEGMAAWLAGPEHSGALASRSSYTTLFRFSQVSQPARWMESFVSGDAVRAYTLLCERIQVAGAYSISPRLPGSHRYMTALDDAVLAALSGQPSDQALQNASLTWQSITDEIGSAEQQAALRRSWGN